MASSDIKRTYMPLEIQAKSKDHSHSFFPSFWAKNDSGGQGRWWRMDERRANNLVGPASRPVWPLCCGWKSVYEGRKSNRQDLIARNASLLSSRQLLKQGAGLEAFRNRSEERGFDSDLLIDWCILPGLSHQAIQGVPIYVSRHLAKRCG